jgi:ParB-like nuclease domain
MHTKNTLISMSADASSDGGVQASTQQTVAEVGERNTELCPLTRLRPHKNNARTHSKKQIRQIANSIKRFGFTNPVLVDDAGEIIAGHGRPNGRLDELLPWAYPAATALRDVA